MPHALWLVIYTAPSRQREELQNSGWVRHTMQSAIWALLTTDSFEDAVVQAVNLGNDADTAGSVLGALAGAAYGEKANPSPRQECTSAPGRLASTELSAGEKLAGLVSLAH